MTQPAKSRKPAPKKRRIFTAPDIDEAKIISPAVPGCSCTYCSNMLVYGYGVRGHGAAPSHRLKGGDEHHNPENRARLLLRDLVTEEQFLGYVSEPGGSVLWFQAPKSGLWYATGRAYGVPGHYVSCCRKKGDVSSSVAVLCLPLQDQSVPLGDIVAAHYLFLTLEETKAWKTAAINLVDSAEGIPEALVRIVRDKGY